MRSSATVETSTATVLHPRNAISTELWPTPAARSRAQVRAEGAGRNGRISRRKEDGPAGDWNPSTAYREFQVSAGVLIGPTFRCRRGREVNKKPGLRRLPKARRNRCGAESLGSDAKGTPAPASALHVGIVELEAGALQRLDVVNFDAAQVHQAHLVYEDLQALKVVNAVGAVRGVLEGHVVLEAGTASADHGHAQRAGAGALPSHDFFHLADRCRSQVDH